MKIPQNNNNHQSYEKSEKCNNGNVSSSASPAYRTLSPPSRIVKGGCSKVTTGFRYEWIFSLKLLWFKNFSFLYSIRFLGLISLRRICKTWVSIVLKWATRLHHQQLHPGINRRLNFLQQMLSLYRSMYQGMYITNINKFGFYLSACFTT